MYSIFPISLGFILLRAPVILKSLGPVVTSVPFLIRGKSWAFSVIIRSASQKFLRDDCSREVIIFLR